MRKITICLIIIVLAILGIIDTIKEKVVIREPMAINKSYVRVASDNFFEKKAN